MNLKAYKSNFLVHSSFLKFIFFSSFSSSIPTENRLKNLELIRERLDELEQLVTYYQTDLHHPYNEATEIPENAPKHFDRLSTELTTKRV